MWSRFAYTQLALLAAAPYSRSQGDRERRKRSRNVSPLDSVLWLADMANHSTESRGLTFRIVILFLLSWSPWSVLSTIAIKQYSDVNALTDQSPTLSLLSIHHLISPTPFRRYCHLIYSDWALYERIDVTLVKETVRGWSVAEMSAHSIQRCDWPTWLWRAKTANHSAELSGPTFRARTANHSAESSGPTFRLLFLLSRFSWQKHYQSITGGRHFVPFFVSWVIITVLIYQF